MEDLPEFRIRAFTLEHSKTGAQHLHLDSEETNNTFSVGFRTTPRDSTGVAHILEHTTLCGSRKFPVRDPFFKMMRRSLNTFMNAMTASDYTSRIRFRVQQSFIEPTLPLLVLVYPFSTQNEKDFNNLLDVYLDAVLNPLLREKDFLQEARMQIPWVAVMTDFLQGHRFVARADGSLELAGVVLNEMKGVLADADTLFNYRLQEVQEQREFHCLGCRVGLK